jgi:hypothetical protein
MMGKGGGEFNLLVGLQLCISFPVQSGSKNFLLCREEFMLANVISLKYNILIFKKILGLFL